LAAGDIQPVATSELTLAPELVAAARGFAKASRAPRTLLEYRKDWQAFLAWCAEKGLNALPAAPEAVALYLTARATAGKKVATLQRELAAISQAHKAAGLASPRSTAPVQEVLKGIRRTLGVAPTEQKAALLPEGLRAMTAALPEGLIGKRDRALLTLGFAGAFRRSELVGLLVEDFAFHDDGLTVTLRRSKTDQEGEGRKVGIPFGSSPQTCPVRAVKAFLAAAELTEGPAFRHINRHGRKGNAALSGHALAQVVKRAAKRAGLDASKYAGHSLRAGLVTAAAMAGKSTHSIMRQTGHKSLAMVSRYIRDVKLFDDNAAAGVGL
jgi:integrase